MWRPSTWLPQFLAGFCVSGLESAVAWTRLGALVLRVNVEFDGFSFGGRALTDGKKDQLPDHFWGRVYKGLIGGSNTRCILQRREV